MTTNSKPGHGEGDPESAKRFNEAETRFVDSARGKVATQEATVARIAHQITAQEAAVEQARTQLVSAQAGSRRMELELNRQNLLVARDASSRQLYYSTSYTTRLANRPCVGIPSSHQDRA